MTTRERLGAWHGGKGDRDRTTDRKKYEDNFEKIFGKRRKKEKECQQQKNK